MNRLQHREDASGMFSALTGASSWATASARDGVSQFDQARRDLLRPKSAGYQTDWIREKLSAAAMERSMAQAEAEARERGETELPHQPKIPRQIRDARLPHALNPEPEPPPAAHQHLVASAHGSHDEWSAVFGDYEIRLAPRRPATSTTASVEKAQPQPAPSEGSQGGDGESETDVGARPVLEAAEESIERWLDDLDSDVEELSNLTQSAMTGVSSYRGSTRADASSSKALSMSASFPSPLSTDALGAASVSRTLCDSGVSRPLDASQDLAAAPREMHLCGQPMPAMPSALATALDSDMGRDLLRKSLPGLRTGTGTAGVDRLARIGRLIGAPLHSERRPDQPSAPITAAGTSMDFTAAGTSMDFTGLIGRVAPPGSVGTDAIKYAAAEAAAAFKCGSSSSSQSEQPIAIRSADAEMEALKPELAPRWHRDDAEMEALKPEQGTCNQSSAAVGRLGKPIACSAAVGRLGACNQSSLEHTAAVGRLGACNQSSLEHTAADARDDARWRLEALEKAAREAAELRRQLAERGYKSSGVHVPPPLLLPNHRCEFTPPLLLPSHQPPASVGGSLITGGFPHSRGCFGGCAVRGSVFSASDFGGSTSGDSEIGGGEVGGTRHHSYELGGGTEVGGSVSEVGGCSDHGGVRSTHAPLSVRSPI